MKNTVIDINNLSKVYRIDPAVGKSGARTLQDDLVAMFRPRPRDERRSRHKEEVWALRDISLQVSQGEVLGVIGRNGAGKTTLLKILSRITEPTSGYADLYGRVGSLLEVGTGFHTELTGRENVYLSGAILGMRRAEIDQKYDEIVDFSGVQKYIDTPVKRYSSGMAVRLAFAVAAHLDPEILLIDEVLAVGDVSFQKKCLGKMSDVAKRGRTIIFVSHDMGAIKELCTHAAWLDGGMLKALGKVDEVVQQYLSDSYEDGEWKTDIAARKDRKGDGSLRFTDFHMRSLDGNPLTAAISGEPVEFVLSYKRRPMDVRVVRLHLWIRDSFGGGMISLSTDWTGQVFTELPSEGKIICRVPRMPLRAGRYFIDLGADLNGTKADRVIRAVPFDVVSGQFYPSGKAPSHPNDGDYLCDHEWVITQQ